MCTMGQHINRARERLFRPITIPGWAALLIFLFAEVPTWHDQISFWSEAAVGGMPYLGGAMRAINSPTGHLVLLLAGLSWIAVFALRQPPTTDTLHQPKITAKTIRRHFLSSSWAGPMTMELMRVAGRPNEKFTFDVLSELFLVNESCDVTVKSVRAEAELVNEGWVRMTQQRDLGDYELILGGDRRNRRDLESLMDKIDGVVLKRGIGYRGWLRFQVQATEEQTKDKVNVKMWIVDALGKEHGITLAAENEIDPSEGELAYSLRHLGS